MACFSQKLNDTQAGHAAKTESSDKKSKKTQIKKVSAMLKKKVRKLLILQLASINFHWDRTLTIK